MKYTSTRNGSLSVTFEEAIFSGYAPDGGLFVPEQLPKVTVDDIKIWSHLTYPQLSYALLRLFICPQEVPDDTLQSLCVDTLQGFDDPNNAVPVRKIGSNYYVAELFHGPTYCFKDFGLRAVINLLSHFSTLRQCETTLLVSTTGDTGPAAVQAVCDVNNPLLTIVVHYPNDQISELQRRQLTTVRSPCVKVVTFEGGGDDMDAPIKRILQTQTSSSYSSKDAAGGVTSKRRICGVNSYNIGRPLMQMVHFVWTYLRVMEQVGVEPGDPAVTLDIVLPTGAMGNLVGGYLAKLIGVPIGMLCSGTNINDITYRVINTGKFHKSDAMQKTLSEAINIQVPYNFERLLYYMTNGNDQLVKEWMTMVDTTSQLDLDKEDGWLDRLQDAFRAARITDEVMCRTARKVKDLYDYTVDPHTAVAIAAAEALGYDLSSSQQADQAPVAIMSTASPCKFQEAVTVAIGLDGWKEYAAKDFPESAGVIMGKEEIAPHVYCKGDDWEALAREIINDLHVEVRPDPR